MISRSDLSYNDSWREHKYKCAHGTSKAYLNMVVTEELLSSTWVAWVEVGKCGCIFSEYAR